MKWIKIKERLPEHGQRCLIFDNSNHVSHYGVKIKIYTAHFYKGEHRPNVPWRACDTGFGNNKFPWNWEEGARKWFSQEVDYWMPLPECPDDI